MESRKCPGFCPLPFIYLVAQVFPCFATNVFAAVVAASKYGLQDVSEEKYDAIGPAFVVELAEHSGVAVVIETEVEGLLGRKRDVDVLAKRHPGCRFSEAAVCGER
jgi:hypothetical protein